MKKSIFRLRNAALACAVTLLGLPVQAATTIPDYPLLSTSKRIPANILMVLDDSGSMAWEYMPDDDPLKQGWDYSFSLKNYNINPLAYNPGKAYQPWMNWNNTRLTGGQDYFSVYTDDTLTKNADDSRLSSTGSLKSSSWRVLFYVPKNSSLASGDKDPRNYYEYSVKYSGSTPTFQRCSETSSSDYSFDNSCTSGVSTPSGRDWSIELTNYATWYSYYRTRNKMAKAGASEAFAQLDENYRVGFDTIWNKDWVNSTSPAANTPAFPIPAGDGKFSSSNRKDWFNQLFYSEASGGTPLRSALRRAGKYYQSETPWDSVDDKGNATYLACRQSFTILTTDGFWNSDSGFSIGGDIDGKDGPVYTAVDKSKGGYKAGPPYKDGASTSYSNTLADVAMYYWENDLRGDLDNVVPKTDQDPAFWQHMATFAISIGAQGSLDQATAWPKLQAQTISWPKPVADSLTAIDDLWHAAVNGHGKFTAATSPDDFKNALISALGKIKGRAASGANLANNGPETTAGSFKYSAIYHSSQFWGDLRALPRNATNDGYSDTPTWKMSDAVNADANFVTRPVLTWNKTAARGGLFTSVQATNTVFNRGGAVSITDNLNYLVGDRSKETASPDKFRPRSLSPIGDIVDSTPIFSNDSGYLFVGANDGMLHGVDSRSGKVAFSYVPAGVDMTALAGLSDPQYTHKFFVDGQLYVSKVQAVGGKNYLVGTLGRGGKGAFALDVTTPTSAGMNDTTKVLWDNTFQAGGDADMGNVLGTPSIQVGQSGNQVALIPNGINSDNGHPVAFMYDMSTGVATKLTTNDATANNGLMVLTSADIDKDGKIDLVYGGDIMGNVWRWDLRTGSKIATRLFTAVGPAGNVQAITGGITLAREGSTGRIFVAFGTGRLITTGDLPWNTGPTDYGQHAETQTIYSLIDSTTPISGRSQLQTRTFPYYGTTSKGDMARSAEIYSELPAGKLGWYIDLGVPASFATGERVISAPKGDGAELVIATMWPKEASNDCNSSAGDGFDNTLNIFTGTNPSFSGDASGTFGYIDINGNGKGDDTLSGAKNTSDNSAATPGANGGYVSSVSHGGALSSPDVSTTDICFQKDDGTVVCDKRTPGTGSASPERLIWRELFNH